MINIDYIRHAVIDFFWLVISWFNSLINWFANIFNWFISQPTEVLISIGIIVFIGLAIFIPGIILLILLLKLFKPLIEKLKSGVTNLFSELYQKTRNIIQWIVETFVYFTNKLIDFMEWFLLRVVKRYVNIILNDILLKYSKSVILYPFNMFRFKGLGVFELDITEEEIEQDQEEEVNG